MQKEDFVKGSQSSTVMRSVTDDICSFESNFWVTEAVVIIVSKSNEISPI